MVIQSGREPTDVSFDWVVTQILVERYRSSSCPSNIRAARTSVATRSISSCIRIINSLTTGATELCNLTCTKFTSLCRIWLAIPCRIDKIDQIRAIHLAIKILALPDHLVHSWCLSVYLLLSTNHHSDTSGFSLKKQHIAAHLLVEANKIYANLHYIMMIHWMAGPRSMPKTVHRIDGESAKMAHKINKTLCRIPNAFALLLVQISIRSFIAA